MDHDQILLTIAGAAIHAVTAQRCVSRVLNKRATLLELVTAEGIAAADLSQINRLVIVGCGKAAAGMCRAVCAVTGEHPVCGGSIVTKYHHADRTGIPSCIEVYEAGHPAPDRAGLEATRHAYELLASLDEHDLLLCVLSGGGSALWTLPHDGIDIDAIRTTTTHLVASGASIAEINIVRKHLSRIKGGRAAQCAYPAQMMVLAISDVIGNDPGVIASGPFSYDKSTYADARAVLERYALVKKTPQSILKHIDTAISSCSDDTPAADNPVFSRVAYTICAANHDALTAACQKANQLQYKVIRIREPIQGDVEVAAELIFSYIRPYQENIHEKICIVSGGEPTVTLTETHGRGGRNQQLALLIALKLQGLHAISFMSLATDGTDGPTDAAGAIVDCDTIRHCTNQGFDPEVIARRQDAYTMFSHTGNLIKTGPTDTNVMDVQVVCIG